MGTITGKTSFSFLNVKEFSSKLEVNTEYGEVNISGIDPGFHLIDLKSKYTDIVLEVPKELSFEVDIIHSESTLINYPEEISKLNLIEVDKKEDIYKTSGSIGNLSGTKRKVNITIN